jgi:hypothetical protein
MLGGVRVPPSDQAGKAQVLLDRFREVDLSEHPWICAPDMLAFELEQFGWSDGWGSHTGQVCAISGLADLILAMRKSVDERCRVLRLRVLEEHHTDDQEEAYIDCSELRTRLGEEWTQVPPVGWMRLPDAYASALQTCWVISPLWRYDGDDLYAVPDDPAWQLAAFRDLAEYLDRSADSVATRLAIAQADTVQDESPPNADSSVGLPMRDER